MRPAKTCAITTAPMNAFDTINEWLRLNGSLVVATFMVLVVQPGLELPILV